MGWRVKWVGTLIGLSWSYYRGYKQQCANKGTGKIENKHKRLERQKESVFVSVVLFSVGPVHKWIHRLKGVITPIIPSALKMLQPPFYLPSKVRIFWVIRFHPSHRWFSRLRNHFTVSLIIPLGDSVFLALISSNLINLIPGCKQHYSKVIFFASTHSKTVNIVICYESWKLSRALYFVHRWNLCKRRL